MLLHAHVVQGDAAHVRLRRTGGGADFAATIGFCIGLSLRVLDVAVEKR